MEHQGTNSIPRWVRLVIDHNPFFLLSAICMMFGCTVLNIALYTPAGDIRNLLILLGVVNIYEAALIGLGAILLRRNDAERRDARTLMGLEALFLADTTFVAGVISTIDARWGWMLDGVLLVLSLVKVVIVARALHLPRANRIVLLVALQLLVILLTPTVFKQIAMRHRGFLPETVIFLAWWVAGLMPVIAAALLWPGRTANSATPVKASLVLAGIYLIVPFLSVLMHVCGAGWVYNFYLASPEISPVLLGVAVALSALHAHRPHLQVVNWQVGLIVAAILCALYGDVTPGKGSVRTSISFEFLGLHVTAVRMTLVGASLTVLHLIWLRRRLYALVAGGACIVGAALWPNLPVIWAQAMNILRYVGNLLARLIPTTAAQWGATSVVAAFVLLGIGAVYSLRRPPTLPAPEPEPDSNPSTIHEGAHDS